MRFFIALELSEINKQQTKQLQDRLKVLIPDIRLTNDEKLHLTLAFLDEQPSEMKDQLIETIRQATDGISSFQVTPAYIDGFPNLHHPRIVWIGVKGDIDKLFIIRERLKDGLKKLDITIDERRYTPHIAIGKLKNGQITDNLETDVEKLASKGLDPITISSIKLFESIPDEGFHSHNTLGEIELAK